MGIMNQLNEPTVDNKGVFNEIAKNKSYKNDYCEKCNNQKSCEICSFGNRGRMLNLRYRIFGRYDYYFQNKYTLNEIKPVKIMDPDDESLLRTAYSSCKKFKVVKKQLMDNVPIEYGGKCPYCMISEYNTFDHYFPESVYPEYILFAPNLVPCCSNCNTKKGKRLFVEDTREFIHFYYDKLPKGQYLKAKLTVENKIPQVSFYLHFEQESDITKVIKNHYERLDLFERYRTSSNGILSSLCTGIKMCLNTGMPLEQYFSFLKFRADSLENTCGTNYWETVIYKAIYENKDELKKLY